jgi:hypothetical protein
LNPRIIRVCKHVFMACFFFLNFCFQTRHTKKSAVGWVGLSVANGETGESENNCRPRARKTKLLTSTYITAVELTELALFFPHVYSASREGASRQGEFENTSQPFYKISMNKTAKISHVTFFVFFVSS